MRGAPRSATWARMLTLLATLTSLSLPGGPPVSMDYLAYDAANDRVWIPAGNTGNVDVFDVKTQKLLTVSGFETAKVKGRDGNDRTVGPSSASAGEGVVSVGNRAGNQICEVDAVALTKKRCIALESSPDGTAYVEATKEIWVTTPRTDSVTIIDAAQMKVVGSVKVDSPEGYAVVNGVYFTNSEDKDKTNAIDIKTRKLTKTFDSKCGAPGPRGIAYGDGKLFVACAAGKVNVFEKDSLVKSIETGEGLDNIDYADGRVYAAGGKSGNLTVGEKKFDTAPGTRVVVADKHGTAYVADSKGGRIIVITKPGE
jgi:hypothetical protein